MRLNDATDYALRILMLLGREGRPATIGAIAARLGLSRTHVMKIVARLVAAEILTAQRGRGGGVGLAHPPEAINIGAVIRLMEPDFNPVACLGPNGGACVFCGACGLTSVFAAARAAFLARIDAATLADGLAGSTGGNALFTQSGHTITDAPDAGEGVAAAASGA